MQRLEKQGSRKQKLYRASRRRRSLPIGGADWEGGAPRRYIPRLHNLVSERECVQPSNIQIPHASHPFISDNRGLTVCKHPPFSQPPVAYYIHRSWYLPNPYRILSNTPTMRLKNLFHVGHTGAVMGFLPDVHRNNVTAFIAELAGTFLFLFFSFAIAQVAHTPPPSSDPNAAPNILVIFFIALGFGCSVAVNVWLFYRVSGGMFNPAVRFFCTSSMTRWKRHAKFDFQVTLTLCLVGAVPATRGVVVVIAQILGGIAAAGAVSATLPGPMAVNVRLGGHCSITQGLFIEMFTTMQLVFTVIMLAAIKHKATFLAPIGIGIALFIGHMLSEFCRCNPRVLNVYLG